MHVNDCDQQPDYPWTWWRRLLGVLLVTAGLGLPLYIVWPRGERIASDDVIVWPVIDQAPGFNFDNLQVVREDILPGGPAKDGIPSLTHPQTAAISEADFLAGDSRVVGVTIDGKSRAYPIGVLNYHEAVNDTLGETHFMVIYCPLCDSVSVVDRTLDEKTYEFGISGMLYRSNVVLYDRTDQALWSQIGLIALSGPNAGRSLRHLDQWEITTFDQWRQAHPESTVMTFNTGHRRNYIRNPYAGYFENDRVHGSFDRFDLDKRMANKTRVIGVKLNGVARAYVIDKLIENGQTTVRDTMGGQAIELSVDGETGTVKVINVPEDAQVVHTFWFAWASFHPETEIYEAAPGD